MKVILLLMAVGAVVSSLKLPLVSELDDIWEEWKTEHGRQYAKVDERQRRMTWERNMRLIDQHNLEAAKGKHTYTLGINQFGDMTPKEYNAMLSANADHEEILDEIPIAEVNSSLSVARSWDWREHGYVTPVKYQGSCGSCYTFSAAGALEGQWFKKTGQLVSLSEQELLDCSISYQKGYGGCEGGFKAECFQYVKDHGILLERKYPYTGQVGKCKYQNATKDVWCKGFMKVPFEDETAMRDTMYTVGPIAVSLNASLDSFQHYKSGVFYSNCSTGTNHAVLAVGYGVDSVSGLNYWIVKNSWGTEWGEEGYIRIARGYNMCGIGRFPIYPIV